MPAEHDGAVAAARAHLEALGRVPLTTLPDGYPEGRAAVHRVAEQTLQVERRAETGSGFLSPFTAGGVGTPAWDRGLRSGEPGAIRIEGAEIVRVTGSAERREPIGTDPAVTAALADFYALATVALAELIAASGDPAPEPIRLWPEHFDAATVLGDEQAGTRANYGASPGDDPHPEPYLYVGPFAEPAPDPFWNAESFTGAQLSHAELLKAPDQLAAARGFFERGRLLLEAAS